MDAVKPLTAVLAAAAAGFDLPPEVDALVIHAGVARATSAADAGSTARYGSTLNQLGFRKLWAKNPRSAHKGDQVE